MLAVGIFNQEFLNFVNVKRAQHIISIYLVFGITNRLIEMNVFTDVEKMYKVIDYYFGSVDNFNDEHIQSFIDMCTDSFFQYGHNRTIEYFLKQNMQVFQYLLTYEGTCSLTGQFCLKHTISYDVKWNILHFAAHLRELPTLSSYVE